MCGIVGILSPKNVAPRLIQSLKGLEYRGYDSAGIAVIQEGKLERCRQPGKLKFLEEAWTKAPCDGHVGIGHIRWATHGIPTVDNAHPHMSKGVAVVHNGIIENHEVLRDQLISKGYVFTSTTDTEVVAHLMADFLKQGQSPLEAAFSLRDQISGSYAIAMIFQDYPDVLIGLRHGVPLAAGQTDQDVCLGSDAQALSGLVRSITYLEDGEIAYLQPGKLEIYDTHRLPVVRHPRTDVLNFEAVSKGPYPHYMLKEIYEQPDVVRQTLSAYLNETKDQVYLPPSTFDWTQVEHITIIACGTSYYAGLVAKYWFERNTGIFVNLDIASEFRYRTPPMPKNGVAIFISQSGETADTLTAFEYAKSCNQYCIGIVNVPNSSLARGVNLSLYTHAGPEIGVASTKAFTTQLSVLACLCIHVAQARGLINPTQVAAFVHELSSLPVLLEQTLAQASTCKDIAKILANAQDVLYLGRGTNYAIALEGALKLKEITYIHAEGYAAGEMKHGPIALIDDQVPVVVVAPWDYLYEKTLSNVQEAASREGQIIMISDAKGFAHSSMTFKGRIEIPTAGIFADPILATIPVQLLAYYTAVAKGTDVDQPRNLAKSVTVE